MSISTGSSTASYIVILDDNEDTSKTTEIAAQGESQPKEPMFEPLSPEASLFVICAFVVVIFTVLLSPLFLKD